ncbi:MAG: sulfite exporter TauE/SafE family protein [Bacteroidetes bacterium]|nr:sulfite exporter TauE/SafE family protein [Bacteroidota bacterium]
MSLYWPAFLIGLLGSFHCVVMCGPLMLAFPFKSLSSLKVFWQALVYQLGRATTYALIGILFFSIGKSLTFLSLQSSLSIIVGTVFILIALANFIPNIKNKFSAFAISLINPSKWQGAIRNNASKTYAKYLLGILNGLLPCGLVYSAALTSILMPTVKSAATNMIFFGFGTFPIMLALVLAHRKMPRFASLSQKLIPAVMLLMGTYFILRGMELGIPYVSPAFPLPGDSTNCVN